MTDIQGRDSTVIAPHSASHGRGAPLRARARVRVGGSSTASRGARPVGIALVLVLGPNKDAPPQHFSSVPAQVPEQQVKAPLATRHAASRCGSSRPPSPASTSTRHGSGRAEPPRRHDEGAVVTGANPVVPYPIDQLEVAPYKIDESYETSALIEVALLPRKGAGVRAQVFFLELKRLGKGKNTRWVVDNWVPRASAVVPR